MWASPGITSTISCGALRPSRTLRFKVLLFAANGFAVRFGFRFDAAFDLELAASSRGPRRAVFARWGGGASSQELFSSMFIGFVAA